MSRCEERGDDENRTYFLFYFVKNQLHSYDMISYKDRKKTTHFCSIKYDKMVQNDNKLCYTFLINKYLHVFYPHENVLTKIMKCPTADYINMENDYYIIHDYEIYPKLHSVIKIYYKDYFLMKKQKVDFWNFSQCMAFIDTENSKISIYKKQHHMLTLPYNEEHVYSHKQDSNLYIYGKDMCIVNNNLQMYHTKYMADINESDDYIVGLDSSANFYSSLYKGNETECLLRCYCFSSRTFWERNVKKEIKQRYPKEHRKYFFMFLSTPRIVKKRMIEVFVIQYDTKKDYVVYYDLKGNYLMSTHVEFSNAYTAQPDYIRVEEREEGDMLIRDTDVGTFLIDTKKMTVKMEI